MKKLNMDLSLKRRTLVGSGILSVGALLGKLLPNSIFAQIPSSDRSIPLHGGSMTMGDVDNLRNGFDPQAILTDWDLGKVSPLPDGRTLREFELSIAEREVEIAPGVVYPAWTYNGRVPGPSLRVTEGDRIRIRFNNPGEHPHTLHFHGIHSARQDGIPGTLEAIPGETVVYEFDAKPFGCHLYHCHSAPFKRHLHKGLYGAFL
ncbi:multicopper oxidase domain-containing protein [Gloeocapsa sp. PCC 73106]|uniref:multicopper oxidase domain-containing protein n=1 Tax=Gloeocapsa sp. PCC 73106 TaxID=102232 RepID=UPI0002ABB45D|nr:multicopper oxidase domain-containing protein [Gloeocapsa sp. PCC 73106]ELR98310.1 putative multicopper oxidase [Gloeocapsa sp. PCC 73106]